MLRMNDGLKTFSKKENEHTLFETKGYVSSQIIIKKTFGTLRTIVWTVMMDFREPIRTT